MSAWQVRLWRVPPWGRPNPVSPRPPSTGTFRVTEFQEFNPRIPKRRFCRGGPALTQPENPAERESNSPRLQPPEAFSRSLRQKKEDKKQVIQEAKRAEREQTWTTSIYGLKEY